MRKFLNVSILLVVAGFWQHCTEDPTPARRGSGHVRFAWQAGAATAGRLAAEVSDARDVIVSIRNAAGEAVYTHKKLMLLTLGGSLISEPLLLEAGEYELTEFLVIRGDQTVIFAAPLEGSELAPLVQDPLPRSFAVGPDAITNLNVEVLDTENQTPEAFGYVTFGFTEVPSPVFQLSIIKPEGQSLVLSRAHVYLLEDGDTIFYQYVPARINTINFVPHAGAQYRLMLYEDGFKRYDQRFQLDDLTGQRVEVMLQPALTFVFNNYQTFFRTVIMLNITEGYQGSLQIDWGDGISVADYPLGLGGYFQAEYNYLDNLPHFVSVWGPLDVIEGVDFLAPGGLDALSVQHLPELKSLTVPFGSSTTSLDISHNPKLEQLFLGFTSIASLDVSENPLLQRINLAGTPFTTSSIDAFVDDLYENVVVESSGLPRNGELNLTVGEEGQAVGPPSEAARAKLSTLANVYGWTIWPEGIIQH